MWTSSSMYIEEKSPEAAVRFSAALDASLQRLAAMPELGQRQEFGRAELAGLRVWQVRGFENYLIFYRPTNAGSRFSACCTPPAILRRFSTIRRRRPTHPAKDGVRWRKAARRTIMNLVK